MRGVKNISRTFLFILLTVSSTLHSKVLLRRRHLSYPHSKVLLRKRRANNPHPKVPPHKRQVNNPHPKVLPHKRGAHDPLLKSIQNKKDRKLVLGREIAQLGSRIKNINKSISEKEANLKALFRSGKATEQTIEPRVETIKQLKVHKNRMVKQKTTFSAQLVELKKELARLKKQQERRKADPIKYILDFYDVGLAADGKIAVAKKLSIQEIAQIQQLGQFHLLEQKVLVTEPITLTKKFEGVTLTIKQLPALSQKVNEADHSNYCGYYAIWFCYAFLKSLELLTNRLKFIPFFTSALKSVQTSRKAGNEPSDLINLDFISTFEMMGIKATVKKVDSYKKMKEVNFWQGPIRECIKQFIKTTNKKEADYSQVYVVNTKSKGGSHWLAMEVKKDSAKKFTVTIADSLGYDRRKALLGYR